VYVFELAYYFLIGGRNIFGGILIP